MIEANYDTVPRTSLDPSLRIAKEHVAKLHDLQIDAAYTMDVGVPLCQSEEIGVPSEQRDPQTNMTSKFAVVGEFSIADSLDDDNKVNGFQHLAVIATKTPQGHPAYLIAGLRPDSTTGKMTIVEGDAEGRWIYTGNPTVVVGREKTALDPAKLWGEGAKYSEVTSRRHIVFSLQPDGRLSAHTLGANGTKGDIGREAQAVAESTTSDPNQVQDHETLQPDPNLRFKPVEKDPAFVQISQPYEQEIRAVEQKYAADLARLEVKYQHDQQSGRANEMQIRAEQGALRKKIADEQAPIRSRYEEAVKPYLKARLDLFSGDMLPGYLQPGQAVLGDRTGAKSVDGASISRFDPYARKYGDAGIYPRFGQLIIDARGGNSWGSSWNAMKTDEKTNEHMPSAQRVINLAAAMIAGTFRGSDDPIQYYRATDRDLAQRGIDLPPEFRSKVPIYRVALGIHRTLAERLISGNDAVFHGDQMDQYNY